MNGDDQSASMEGLDEGDIKNFIGEEEEEENQKDAGSCYLDLVEQQNDLLIENKFKEFMSVCKDKKSKIDFQFSKQFFLKESNQKATISKEVTAILSMDAGELKNIVISLKNSIMGMRVKVAQIIDFLSQSESDPTNSINFINLRVEILCEYWSYLSLLVMMKVSFYYSA